MAHMFRSLTITPPLSNFSLENNMRLSQTAPLLNLSFCLDTTKPGNSVLLCNGKGGTQNKEIQRDCPQGNTRSYEKIKQEAKKNPYENA